MSKISLIIQREYLTRVRKRSFVVMTILGPLLMAAIMIVPIYVATMTGKENKIAVLDESGIYYEKFTNTEKMRFQHVHENLNKEKAQFLEQGFDALLYIPKREVAIPVSAILYSDKQVNINVKSHIENVMKKEVESLKLAASGIDKNILESIKTSIDLTSIKLDEGGKEEKSFTEVSMAVGMFSGILIYFFIFLFGAQVMRGVIEEKTSRIVEVIISSVKPFELMLGKIIGVALVGLTQFLLWVILTFGIVTIFQTTYSTEIQGYKSAQIMNNTGIPSELAQKADTGQSEVGQIFEAISTINFLQIILAFLFYFIGGYLLYAALFAAIGSAVDNEADTQQFMLPVTVPLILSIIMAQYVINDPEGPVSFWLSMIPLTSPIIMMIRIPFGVPVYELILSMALLVGGFLGATWLAAKIYRTGILMYGKKVDYRELWKWITFKA
jgi:ABC-2 type transport system permease protein